MKEIPNCTLCSNLVEVSFNFNIDVNYDLRQCGAQGYKETKKCYNSSNCKKLYKKIEEVEET